MIFRVLDRLPLDLKKILLEKLMTNVIATIEDSTKRLLQHPGYITWQSEQGVASGDLVLVNNSFVFRDVKTSKSSQYLSLKAEEGEPLFFKPVVVEQTRINSDFKRFRASSNLPPTLNLTDAVTAQLSSLGEIVFLLIGEVDDSLVASVNLDVSGFDEAVWDPKLHDLVKVGENRILVRATDDEDKIWQEVERHFREQAENPPEALRDGLGIALDKLQDEAAAKVKIPTGSNVSDLGITDTILTVLREQRDEYVQAVDLVVGDGEGGSGALNNILRLAYNFSSDAAGYLRLIVSVCDLKPIVLWATIAEHYSLSEAFQRLPWSRSHRKASLKNYHQTIADARNSAFHNLFPFRKTLHVELPEAALGRTELRIFSEHAKKRENQLTYQDKGLVDVLVEFTRARERSVPMAFWVKNLDVMDATIELFKATNDFLKVVASERVV